MPWRRKLAFSLILIAGTLGLLEATASLLYYLTVPETKRDVLEVTLEVTRKDNTVLRYTPHPYFNFVSNPDYVFPNGHKPHNEWGLRGPMCCTGPKSKNLIRVVALGGSTTYGMLFTFGRNVWPALLGSRLQEEMTAPVEVINAGVPYYTTFEMIGMTAMLVPEFDADVVLLHTGGNDAFTVGFPDEGGPDNRYFRHAFSYRPPPSWAKTLMRNSYTLRLVGLSLLSQEGYVPGDMAQVIQYGVPQAGEMIGNAERATGKYFERNLEALIVLAKHDGVVPVVVNEAVNPNYDNVKDRYHHSVARAIVRNNRISKEVARRHGALYIDLYSGMRNPKFFVDAAHANKAGMHAKAELIARDLLPLLKRLTRGRTPHQ